MPAALEVDWYEVKTLALAIGVREAARRMGISEEATMKRCQREEWLKEAEVTEARIEEIRKEIRVEQGLSATVRTAGEILREMGPDTRLGHAIAANKLARKFEKMDPDELLLSVPLLAQAGKHAATVHEWGGATINVGMRLDQIAGVTSVGLSVSETPEEVE